MIATVLVAEDTLTLVDLRPAREDSLAPVDAHESTLAWRFDDDAGRGIASGSLVDPRLVRSEFDADGAPDPVEAHAGAGVLEIELPNTGGMLSIAPPSASPGAEPLALGGPFGKLTLAIHKLIAPFFTLAAESETATERVAGEPGCAAFDILLVSEGYTREQRHAFEADAAWNLDALKDEPTYAANFGRLRIWRKFIPSEESGISDTTQGLVRNTAFRVEHRGSRTLGFGTGVSPQVVAELAQARAEAHADVTVLIVNTGILGAGMATAYAGARTALVPNHWFAGFTLIHELGHSLFDLGDEYAHGNCLANSHPRPNIAHDLGAIPWQHLLSPGVSLPTTDLAPWTVGAYEGALYCPTGKYRPQHDCLMRSTWVGFCAVCADHVARTFQKRTAACASNELCGHGECQTGAALSAQCGGCTAAVCAQRASCCLPGGTWDLGCVQIARNLAGACHGVCADGQSVCNHSECALGDALTPSCSSCAASVCAKDPHCCSTAWDAACVERASADPFCACLGEREGFQ